MMQQITNQAIFIFFTMLGIYLLYALSPILSPFLLGALFAYLANPLVKQLDRWYLPHLLSVIAVFIFLFFLLLLLIISLIPLIQKQIFLLVDMLPQIIAWIQSTLLSRLSKFISMEAFQSNLSSTLSKAGWVLSTLLRSGYAFFTWIMNLVLIPIVTFYLLRDWDRLLNKTKNLFPVYIKPTLIKLVKECDEVLSAFFRGQLLVMFCLCLIYGVGLTLTGLHVGLLIGLIGGLLSIIPYLGAIFILLAASMAAIVQFGQLHAVLWVLLVFLIGQTLESVVLTPYIIGDRIGLHPVAIIFAIMAGGTLFGFFGVLVALPFAAILMVLIRFGVKY